jgi:D-amino peptidase
MWHSSVPRSTTFSHYATAQSASPKKLKIYVSVDMEGVVGTVTADQLRPGSFEYERYREFMTRETLAAIKAAKEAGATDVIVADAHGNGENLLIEEFPKDVHIIRSFPRRLGLMAGIDKTFDAVLLIGYHASTNNVRGIRAHTFSSARLTRVALNGKEVTEAAFAAATAGQFSVPVIMMSGDDAAISEVRSQIGNIEAAETKKTLGFHSGNTLTPEASYELIGEKVKAALDHRTQFKPYILQPPITLEISFKNHLPAEVLSYLRAVQRIDSHSIRFQGKDMAEVADFIEFVQDYNLDLEP